MSDLFPIFRLNRFLRDETVYQLRKEITKGQRMRKTLISRINQLKQRCRVSFVCIPWDSTEIHEFILEEKQFLIVKDGTMIHTVLYNDIESWGFSSRPPGVFQFKKRNDPLTYQIQTVEGMTIDRRLRQLCQSLADENFLNTQQIPV